MPSQCANSISTRRRSCRMASPSRRQRAALIGSTKDTLLLSSAYGEGMATTSGYARTVRLWRRGEPADHALVVFEAPIDRMAVYCSLDDTEPVLRVWFIERLDFFNQNIWLGDETGAKSKLELPTDTWMETHR